MYNPAIYRLFFAFDTLYKNKLPILGTTMIISLRNIIYSVIVSSGLIFSILAMEEKTDNFYLIVKKLEAESIITFNPKTEQFELTSNFNPENDSHYPSLKKERHPTILPPLTRAFKVIQNYSEPIQESPFCEIIKGIIKKNGTPSVFTPENICSITACINNNGKLIYNKNIYLNNLFDKNVLSYACTFLVAKKQIPDGPLNTIIAYWRPQHPWRTVNQLRTENIVWSLGVPKKIDSYKKQAEVIINRIFSIITYWKWTKQKSLIFLFDKYNLTPEQLKLYYEYSALHLE